MELFFTIMTSLIFCETTALLFKVRKTPLISNNQRRKIYVDTSALMDQRLLPVAQTGWLSDEMIVTRSVIHELQLLADGKDHDKRTRARAGLDQVRDLERVVYFNLTILSDELDRTPVDDRLLELAKKNHGLIMTNDFNLIKVATAEHIETLNLNELALVLSNNYLPGERALIKVVTAGSSPKQGVGYLKDGTMVVIDQAQKHIGREVEVEFQRISQTAAGSMLFAKLVTIPKMPKQPKNPPQQQA